MNKMAAAFLSLFTLVLVLGVLYITSPSKELQVSKITSKPTNQQSDPVSEQSKQLADQNNSMETKVQALKEEVLNQQKIELIAMLEKAFSKDNQQCEVTINENNIRVLIKGIPKEEKVAESIMKEAYNLTKHKYFIEVAFQEK